MNGFEVLYCLRTNIMNATPPKKKKKRENFFFPGKILTDLLCLLLIRRSEDQSISQVRLIFDYSHHAYLGSWVIIRYLSSEVSSNKKKIQVFSFAREKKALDDSRVRGNIFMTC